MMGVRWILVAMAATGCTPNLGGLGTGPDGASGSDGGTSSSTGSGVSTSEGSATTTGVDGSGSGSESSTSSSTGDPDSTSTGEPPPTAGSCAEILAQDPNAPTGIHSIVRPSDGRVMEVHCEMDLDDGGWTLAGRSEPDSEQGPFGWGEARGTLGDDQNPYSLDVVDVGLAFDEILVARRTGFATPEANAYALDVPQTFVADYAADQLDHMSLRVVLGACTPGGVSMLRRVGYTANDESFFLRDNQSNDVFGLRSNGFTLVYEDCDRGAELHDRQGAVFVR